MEPTSKPALPDNAEDAMKCPVCGAMVNIAGVMGPITCPVCGRIAEADEAKILGASNEGY